MTKQHLYFSGIGGAGIGPLALIAHKAGYRVSGSDQKQNSTLAYLQAQGIKNIHIGQGYDEIAEVHTKHPIDWFIYTSALPMDQPDAPELRFCRDHHIKATKRDEFLSQFLRDNHLQLIAVAGTHGKTTTTAMAVWLAKQLSLPVSFLVPAKTSFADMGDYDPNCRYFIYEADEYDRNFLAFHPRLSLITGVDWDHQDIYPTFDNYKRAFQTFLGQSQHSFVWNDDARLLGLSAHQSISILDNRNPDIDAEVTLTGRVNRQDAWLVAQAFTQLTDMPFKELLKHLNRFPGLSRRFEAIAPHLYSDYAHTPPKVRGALQHAHEVAGTTPVVVVYEGLHNTRQHAIKAELAHLFDDVSQLYIVPSYLARENPNLPLLQPEDLRQLLSPQAQNHTQTAHLDANLQQAIANHLKQGHLVLCISAGGGGSLDEWLRQHFSKKS